jgi:hypothetical protein
VSSSKSDEGVGRNPPLYDGNNSECSGRLLNRDIDASSNDDDLMCLDTAI